MMVVSNKKNLEGGRFDAPEVSSSTLLIEFYKHAAGELNKLIEKDPEKFLYIVAGSAGGAILAIATSGASLTPTVIGSVAGAAIGLAALGVKRIVLPTDILQIHKSADEMVRELKRLHNSDTHFSSLMLRKLEIIAERVEPNLQGDIPEAEAQKLARQLKSVSKSVEKRIALHDAVVDFENNCEKFLSFAEKFSKKQRFSLNDKEKEITPLVTSLRDGSLRSKGADSLLRKLASYNLEIAKTLS